MGKYKHRYAGANRPSMTRQERIDALYRNGITARDLQRSFDEGFERGRSEGVTWGMDCLLGSLLLALHRQYGFGASRLSNVVMTAAQIQIEELTNRDVLDRLVEETGLALTEYREMIDEGGVG